MSQDEIHDVAQRSTPPEVPVPNGWPALIVWAVGKFGVGVILAGLLALALDRVYSDSKEQDVQQRALTERVAEAFETQSAVGVQQSLALKAVVEAVENNTDELEKMRNGWGAYETR